VTLLGIELRSYLLGVVSLGIVWAFRDAWKAWKGK
jgi:hypothetical protein